MKQFEVISIANESHIGQACRATKRVAAEIGFTERQLAEIDIAVKEAGSNAVKFGRATGQLYFSCTDEEVEPRGIEIIYTDKGPGIEDTALALEDGYTTSGSMGAGLGAIKRMMDEFYIYSSLESQTRKLSLYGRSMHGTAIVIRKHLNSTGEAAGGQAVWGAMTRSSIGEDVNGDAYVIARDKERLVLAVIDGLGHGIGASEAAQAAFQAIKSNSGLPVEMILRASHEALRPTRGAVVGLCAVDSRTREIEYAGIGNTDFRAFGGGKTLRFISLNGTLGSRLERIKTFREQLPRVTTLAMSTDGISERWELDSYPGLLGLHPQLISAVVMRDFGRPKDDATILCGRLSL